MKLGTIALSSATVLSTLISTISHSQAATIVNQDFDLVKPPYPSDEVLFQFSEIGLTNPDSTVYFTSDQRIAPNINNNNNDTGLTFDQFTFQILSPNAQFGNVTSNAFKVAISSDDKTATFSNALIRPREGFGINRTVNDGSPVDFKVSLRGVTAVPEPTATLAIVAVGAFGVAFKIKKAA